MILRWIDYGLGGLEASALELVPPDERDLSSLYQRLAEQNELCGYEVSERFYEIGSPESLAETDEFVRGGPAAYAHLRTAEGDEARPRQARPIDWTLQLSPSRRRMGAGILAV
jgi:NDP-sugar pyrophosphorylase family protein